MTNLGVKIIENSWDYNWWLQHFHLTSWAQWAWCAREVEDKECKLEEQVLWHEKPVHHIVMLYWNPEVWKSPSLFEPVFKIVFLSPTSSSLPWVLYHTPSLRNRSGIVNGSPTGSNLSWDLWVLCLQHGSKLPRNSAFKTGNNAHVRCYF